MKTKNRFQIPEDIAKKIPPINKKRYGMNPNQVTVAKIYSPYSEDRWYIVEGRKEQDGDWFFLGFVERDSQTEFGNFSLAELNQEYGTLIIERECFYLSEVI